MALPLKLPCRNRGRAARESLAGQSWRFAFVVVARYLKYCRAQFELCGEARIALLDVLRKGPARDQPSASRLDRQFLSARGAVEHGICFGAFSPIASGCKVALSKLVPTCPSTRRQCHVVRNRLFSGA